MLQSVTVPRVVLQSRYALKSGAFTENGTLQEWQEHIATPAIGNDLFVLSISGGFAGPLLMLTNTPSGGIHTHGSSQIGKTTLLGCGASVWGRGAEHNGHIRSWRTTGNALEATAAEHCDNTLYLDEIAQGSAREAGEIIYMLANGQGKARMSRDISGRPPLTWRILVFSTGETTLAGRMSEVGLRAHAGQEVRLLNLPADAGRGFGVFQDLHGATNAQEFADKLRGAAVTYYGTAGPAFLRKLVPARHVAAGQLEVDLQKRQKTLVAEMLPSGADGQVHSAAARFALIGIAGELAREYGVVPWPEGEAVRAAKACFRAWLFARGGVGAAEDARAVSVLELFIALHGVSRFEDLGKPPEEQRVINRAGFVRQTKQSERQYLIFPAVWRDEIFKGMDAGAAAKAICGAGFLLRGEAAWSRPVKISGHGVVRVYVVKGSILGRS